MNKQYLVLAVLLSLIVSNLGAQSVVATYTDRNAFLAQYQTNCNTTIPITNEAFLGGPNDFSACGLLISSAGDDCFPPNEIEDGISVQVSNNTNTFYFPPFQDTTALIGSETAGETIQVNFTLGTATIIGLDIWQNLDTTTRLRIYDESDILIEELLFDIPLNVKNFFGFITDVPVSRVEIEGENNSGPVIGDVLFGACDLQLAVTKNELSRINLYPNPTKGELNIKLPGKINIDEISIIDVFGREVILKHENNILKINNLSAGVYFIKIKTGQGAVIKRIIKES